MRVRSAVALDAPIRRASVWDLEIGWGERRPIPNVAPQGQLLAQIEFPDGGSSLTATSSGYIWRVSGICDFVLDQPRRNAQVHMAPDAEEELASVFAGGFLAKVLALNQCCVLHASAIEVDAGVVAFVGASGSGKTTVAALCCIAGARVVTDDVLRVELQDGRGWCYGGSHALRLRPGAAELAEHLHAAARRPTLDERTAVSPDSAEGPRLPLAAFVAPQCVHGSSELRVERLRGSEALRELLRFPRTIGWVAAESARRDFGVLADLVAAVPVYRAELPWGQHVDRELGRRLLTQLGFEAEAHSRESVGAIPREHRGMFPC